MRWLFIFLVAIGCEDMPDNRKDGGTTKLDAGITDVLADTKCMCWVNTGNGMVCVTCRR